MIGLDTNVVLRALVGDDPVQTLKARAVLNGLSPERPGYLSLVVIVEMEWVMRSSMKMPREAIAKGIGSLLQLPVLRIQNFDQVALAMQSYGNGADLADALIADLGAAEGCDRVLTFDEVAARRLPCMELVA